MSSRRKLQRRLVVGDENNDRKRQEEEVVASENNDGKQQQEEKEQEKEEVAPALDATNNNLEEEHQSDSDSSMNSLSKFILKPIGCPGGYVKEDEKWEEDKTNNDSEKEVNEKVKKKKNKKSGGEDEKEKDVSIADGRVLVLALTCQEGNNVASRKGAKIVKALQTGETSGNNVAPGKGKRIVKLLETGETSDRKTVKKQKIEKLKEPELKEKGIIVKDEKKFVCLKEYLKVELEEGHRGVVMERLFTLGEKRLEEFDAKCQSLRLTELELCLKRNQLVAEVLRAAGF